MKTHLIVAAIVLLCSTETHAQRNTMGSACSTAGEVYCKDQPLWQGSDHVQRMLDGAAETDRKNRVFTPRTSPLNTLKEEVRQLRDEVDQLKRSQ